MVGRKITRQKVVQSSGYLIFKLFLAFIFRIFIIAIFITHYISCTKDNVEVSSEREDMVEKTTDIDVYEGVLQSEIYKVYLTKENVHEQLVVFQSSCPEYEPGKMNMAEKDQYPLNIFKGRTINWSKFSFSGNAVVEIVVEEQVTEKVVVLPSRYGIFAVVDGNDIRFTISQPGQYSVEIGENGYKNGLMIFADPVETDIPDTSSTDYCLFESASTEQVNAITPSYSGIYFKGGVHNIGVYQVPAHIKNIYFEEDAWVYGALIMDGNPHVKIFGRGVLSSGKLNYRESHCIEAINQSDNIHVEGIVVTDPKYFAVRLIGQNNTVKWIKVIGGWVYNCDGITAYAGSQISNCFIWTNDDAIKVYRDNITWSDCVIWQLNNGGIIQMSWGGSNASNINISGIDVLHAEWNKPAFNRALLSCVGNRYKEPGKYGIQKDWTIEHVVTETPIPIVFNITPDDISPNHIHNLILKNWKVQMTMNTEYINMIIGNDPEEYFDGFVFDNFIFNERKLTQSNWKEVTGIVAENLITPEFK